MPHCQQDLPCRHAAVRHAVAVHRAQRVSDARQQHGARPPARAQGRLRQARQQLLQARAVNARLRDMQAERARRPRCADLTGGCGIARGPCAARDGVTQGGDEAGMAQVAYGARDVRHGAAVRWSAAERVHGEDGRSAAPCTCAGAAAVMLHRRGIVVATVQRL